MTDRIQDPQNKLGRHDRFIKELEHDPYHSKVKYEEGTHCPDCSATYHDGRWTWEEAVKGAPEKLCPACQRVRDKVPAAYLTIKGEFFPAHKEEILHMIRNLEEREKQEHPLKRIMNIEEAPDGTELTFTDAHLASGVGHALEDAYQGELDIQYTKGESLLRVYWTR